MIPDTKILIVDDEPIMRDVLVFRLRKEGYHVQSANDGEAALKILASEKFDIIITDILMPFISGFELLKSLKEQKSESPILMLTSLESDTAEAKAFELGADDFMTKPFSPGELSKRIKKLLA